MSDDYSANSETTGVLTLAATTRGNFETNYDADWFKISLDTNTTYLFSLLGNWQGGGTLDGDLYGVALKVFDKDGRELSSTYSIGEGIGPIIQFIPNATGDYYVAALAMNGESGTYTLSAAVQGADDFPSDSSTSGVLEAGGKVQAIFEVAGDRDWFKFHAQAGQHYVFGYRNEEPGSVYPSGMELYDQTGRLLTDPIYPFEPVVSGDYFLGVESNRAGPYTVVSRLLQDDYSGNNATTGLLIPGGQVTGELQYKYDTDRFKITLQADAIYKVELAGTPEDQDELQVFWFDSSGNPMDITLAHTRSGALTATFRPSVSGDFYVDVYGEGLWRGTHGPYTLKASAALLDEIGDTAATATALAIGAEMTASIQWQRDVDVAKLTLQAGTTYALELLVPVARADNVPGLGLMVSGPDGVVIGRSTYGEEHYFSFTPATADDYFIAIAPLYNASDPAPYSLKASVALDDYGANAGHAGVLVLGGATAGTLEAGGGDRDWFAVALDAGSTYWFSLEGAMEYAGTLKPTNGALVKILDVNGVELATTRGDPYLTAPVLPFVPDASGTYFVEVSDPNRATGTYRLAASIGEPDDFGHDATTAGVLADGERMAGRLEVASDKDVFKLNVTAGNTYVLEFDSLPNNDEYWARGISFSAANGDKQDVALRSAHKNGTEMYRLFEATESGDYYLSVNGKIRGEPGSYALLASSAGIDDYPADNTTTGMLAPNGQLQGTLSYVEDSDYVKLKLEAGKSYVVELRGTLSGGGSLNTGPWGPTLALRDSNGGMLATSQHDSAEPRLAFTAPATADYYLSVKAYERMGSYTLSATTTTGDASVPLLTGQVALPGSMAVGLAQNIVFSFNETIRVGSAPITLRDADGIVVPLPALAVSNMLVINPNDFLQPGMTYTLELPEGSVLDLAGNSYAGLHDTTFSTAPAVAAGGAGNDYLIGDGLGRTLIGGAGIDTAKYEDSPFQYDVIRGNNQAWVALRGASAGDALVGVERLMFSTSCIALDIEGTGGQAYRLYQAAFGREPDTSGVGYWISVMDNGLSLHDTARAFLTSAEFTSLYGSAPTDAAFVNQLYSNALHRAPDAGGATFWLQALHDGVPREDILAYFSESAENQAALIGVIGNGFEYLPVG